MLTMFVEGGFPMWFLLAFGLATLSFAGRFAWVPAQRTLKTTLGLGGATAFATLTGLVTDLATVGHQAPSYLRGHRETTMVDVLLQGFAESCAPAIFGFTMLSLAGLMIALGFQREAAASRIDSDVR
ncbi:MAG: hypothetical protein ABSC94_28250 [Polyangiaceae bacterium]|jgi:hypothetical protein